MNNPLCEIGVYTIHDTLKLNQKYPVILGSSSPRRIELLKKICKEYTVKKPLVDENKILNDFFKKDNDLNFLKKSSLSCSKIAYEKAKNIHAYNNDDSLIISADTIVVTEDKVLGKPIDEEDSYNTLICLLGGFHYIVTGVCLYIDEDNYSLFYVISGVKFIEYNAFSRKFIEEYVKSKSPLDKAGSYNIQEVDSYLVEGVFGDYLNIVGFPVVEIRRRLYENFN